MTQSRTDNVTNILVFSLSGLNVTLENRYVYFLLTSVVYYVILLCNIIVIVCIVINKQLHEPMYVFLCNLCINALYGTTGFYPKFMYDLLTQFQEISYAGCLIQVFVIYSSALCDVSTLTVMAYDRYMAICKPLEYHSEMNNQKVVKCIIFCWLPPIICMAIVVLLTARLTLCGSNIEKMYCETWAVVKLACSSTTVNNVIGYIIIIVYFGHAVLIVYSYIHLIRSFTKSNENKYRFMQTCVPHLLALFNIAVALLFDVFYSRYGYTVIPQSLRNFMALDFLLVPPVLNPLIYGLKLAKIRKQLIRMIFGFNIAIG